MRMIETSDMQSINLDLIERVNLVETPTEWGVVAHFIGGTEVILETEHDERMARVMFNYWRAIVAGTIKEAEDVK